jgi:poly(A) polymerase
MVAQATQSLTRTDEKYQKAADIVKSLQDAGYRAYFVGGCVRDLLMELTPRDYDIATNATPDEVGKLFAGAKGVGKQFGVSIVPTDAGNFEVAAFRKDGFYYDHRRPAWVDYADLADDALRRDFTVNALYFDPIKEEIVDLVDGRADLEKRILRVIGDPFERLDEDWLRLLRAVRFACRFRLKFDPRTWDALRTLSPLITGISSERCTEEIRLILQGPNSGRAIGLLYKCGLWKTLWPDLPFSTRRVRKTVSLLKKARSKTAVWPAFLIDLPEAVLIKVCENLKLTRADKKAIGIK